MLGVEKELIHHVHQKNIKRLNFFTNCQRYITEQAIYECHLGAHQIGFCKDWSIYRKDSSSYKSSDEQELGSNRLKYWNHRLIIDEKKALFIEILSFFKRMRPNLRKCSSESKICQYFVFFPSYLRLILIDSAAAWVLTIVPTPMWSRNTI